MNKLLSVRFHAMVRAQVSIDTQLPVDDVVFIEQFLAPHFDYFNSGQSAFGEAERYTCGNTKTGVELDATDFEQAIGIAKDYRLTMEVVMGDDGEEWLVSKEDIKTPVYISHADLPTAIYRLIASLEGREHAYGPN